MKEFRDNFDRLEYAQEMLMGAINEQHAESNCGSKVSPKEIAARHEAADWAVIVLALERMTD